jgi:DNA-binding transcriptional ArsR family regulator
LIKIIDKSRYLYNYIVMEQVSYTNAPPNLDAIFAALADPTRRAILSRLVEGQASVNEIAAPFKMSQPAVSRHLKVLERAGLIERDIDQQRRPAKLKGQAMVAAVDWLTDFKAFWGTSFDQLDNVLINMKLAEGKETDHE